MTVKFSELICLSGMNGVAMKGSLRWHMILPDMHFNVRVWQATICVLHHMRDTHDFHNLDKFAIGTA